MALCVDPSPEMLHLALAPLGAEADGVTTLLDDALAFSRRKDHFSTYDVALLKEMVHHVPQQQLEAGDNTGHFSSQPEPHRAWLWSLSRVVSSLRPVMTRQSCYATETTRRISQNVLILS